jgi:hypothetical protein
MLRVWVGLTHDDWQKAYALLQFIMQIVTVEVCASLIFPAASAPPASPTMLAKPANTTAAILASSGIMGRINNGTILFLGALASAPHSAASLKKLTSN